MSFFYVVIMWMHSELNFSTNHLRHVRSRSARTESTKVLLLITSCKPKKEMKNNFFLPFLFVNLFARKKKKLLKFIMYLEFVLFISLFYR